MKHNKITKCWYVCWKQNNNSISNLLNILYLWHLISLRFYTYIFIDSSPLHFSIALETVGASIASNAIQVCSAMFNCMWFISWQYVHELLDYHDKHALVAISGMITISCFTHNLDNTHQDYRWVFIFKDFLNYGISFSHLLDLEIPTENKNVKKVYKIPLVCKERYNMIYT